MAKIWYFKEGLKPDNIGCFGNPRCEISVEQCQRLFRTERIDYLSKESPESSSDRPDLTRVRDPNIVVVEIDKTETNQRFPHEGYYIISDLSVEKAGEILKANNL